MSRTPLAPPPRADGLPPPPPFDMGPRTIRRACGGEDAPARVFAAAVIAGADYPGACEAVRVFRALLDEEVQR